MWVILNSELLPLTEAFYYILLALYCATAHGYGIMQEVERMSDGRVVIGAGTLYTALNTLVKKGLIEAAESTNPSDTRRKFYAITESGRLVIQRELIRLEELVANGKRILNKLGETNNELC